MLKEISSLQFGEFTLDRHARQLRRLETILPVTGKAFDLLVYMAENPGRPLSKTELLEAVWPETSVEESNLSQNVFLLRRVLGTGGDGPIKTLSGRGYQFAAQVSEITVAGTSDSYTLPNGATHSSASMETTHTRMVVEGEEQVVFIWRRPVLAASIALAIALAAGLVAYRHFSRGAGAQSSAPISTAAARPAVAVLGFRNASSRPEDEWLSTAVAEMLASEMSADDRLRVIPNGEVSQAQSDIGQKAGSADNQESRTGLRRVTGADMLVRGSYVIVPHGTTPALRLMVQAEDAQSGKQLASFSETGEVGALFALVDQAGTELRKHLSDNGAEADDARALSGMSQNAEAMRLYAEAVNQTRRFDVHGARGLFEGAVEADPKFALAHLGLADAWSDLGFSQRAKDEATKAYQLSTGLPRAQRLAIEADYRQLSNDPEKSISLYKALFTFYPDDVNWGIKLATAQRDSGDYHESVDTLEQVRKLPLTPAELVEVIGRESGDLAYFDDAAVNDRARAMADQAVSIAESQGGLFIRAAAFRAKCFTLSHLGPYLSAQKVCEQSRADSQAIGNLASVAAGTNNLGALAEQLGDVKEADAKFQEARQQFHQLGDLTDEAFMLKNLVEMHLDQGALETAMQEGTELGQTTGTAHDKYFSFKGYYSAAAADMLAGRLAEARATAFKALDAAEKQDPSNFKLVQQARVKSLLGSIALFAGDLRDAQQRFDASDAMLKSSHDLTAHANMSVSMARLAFERGHPGKSVLDDMHNAIAVLIKQDEPDYRIQAEVLLAELDLETGDTAGASHAMGEVNPLDNKTASVLSHLTILLGNAELQQALGHLDQAREIYQREVLEAHARGYAYYALQGEIASAKLTQKAGPSAENASRLRILSQQAEHAGFKGLSRQALAPQA